MSPRVRIAFILVVAAQLALLIGMVGFKEFTLQTGTDVVLQTVPVDPRSLLQGDYVILRYEIGIPERARDAYPLLRNLPSANRGSQWYVTLKQQGGVWVATGYYLSRQQAGPVAIKGNYNSRGELDFGIGTYFVPEGTGLAIERANDVKVRVAVDTDGTAVIKEVLVDGRPFDPSEEPGR